MTQPDNISLSGEEARAIVAQRLAASSEAAAAAMPSEVPGGQALVDAGAAGGTLPNETTMDALMAEFRAMADRMAGLEQELAVTRQSQVAGRAPDDLVLYSQNLADWLALHEVQNGDLPGGHFDKPKAAAAALVDASVAATGRDAAGQDTGSKDPARLSGIGDLVATVERFIGKTHPRVGRKYIDFSVVEYDLEMILAAAERLAA